MLLITIPRYEIGDAILYLQNEHPGRHISELHFASILCYIEYSNEYFIDKGSMQESFWGIQCPTMQMAEAQVESVNLRKELDQVRMEAEKEKKDRNS